MDINAFADEFKVGRIAVLASNSDEMRAIVRLIVNDIGLCKHWRDGFYTRHLLNGGDTLWETCSYNSVTDSLCYGMCRYYHRNDPCELVSYSDLNVRFPDNDTTFIKASDDQFAALLFGN